MIQKYENITIYLRYHPLLNVAYTVDDAGKLILSS